MFGVYPVTEKALLEAAIQICQKHWNLRLTRVDCHSNSWIMFYQWFGCSKEIPKFQLFSAVLAGFGRSLLIWIIWTSNCTPLPPPKKIWPTTTPVRLRTIDRLWMPLKSPTFWRSGKGAQNSQSPETLLIVSDDAKSLCFHGWWKTRWNKANFDEFVGFLPRAFSEGILKSARPFLSRSISWNCNKLRRWMIKGA